MMANVTATATGQASYGVHNSYSSPKMINMTATASGGTLNIGIHNAYGSPTMVNVTATATGANSYGVDNYFSSLTMTNVIVSASGETIAYGVYSAFGGTVKINNSVVKGITNTIFNEVNTTTLVGNTQLDGGAVSNAGTLTCVGAYNGIYVSLSTTCL
jgi:hypothetical protein